MLFKNIEKLRVSLQQVCSKIVVLSWNFFWLFKKSLKIERFDSFTWYLFERLLIIHYILTFFCVISLLQFVSPFTITVTPSVTVLWKYALYSSYNRQLSSIAFTYVKIVELRNKFSEGKYVKVVGPRRSKQFLLYLKWERIILKKIIHSSFLKYIFLPNKQK